MSIRNPESTGTFASPRFDELSDQRLDTAQEQLRQLRHQPLDPHVLDHVSRAEREAERWNRVAGALARNRQPVGLKEDPGSMMARVLNEVRESWRGTGLQVTGSFRRLDPRCFDRRVYMETIRCSIDFLLAGFERPRTLEGRIDDDADQGSELLVELFAEGDGARLDPEELALTQHLAERVGCAFQASASSCTIAGAITLGVRREALPRPRYIFDLKAG